MVTSMDPSQPAEWKPAEVAVVDGLSRADIAAVNAVVAVATAADGVAPLGEHVLLHLKHGGDPAARHVLARRGGAVVGYGHLDRTDPVSGPAAELVVHPDFRRSGIGRAVVSRLLAESAGQPLRLWAHGRHSAARRLAESMGFVRVRELHQLRRSLSVPLPEVAVPDGVTVRTFRPGADDEAWLAVNRRAFADHPEQGSMTQTDLQRRMREPWFDPAGFFLAWRGERLLGFHWTKVHGNRAHGHDPVGEVYAVGTDPGARGSGLGTALTVIGLRHLRELGLGDAMLYVEADSRPALSLYERLGFTHRDTDVMYRHPGSRSR